MDATTTTTPTTASSSINVNGLLQLVGIISREPNNSNSCCNSNVLWQQPQQPQLHQVLPLGKPPTPVMPLDNIMSMTNDVTVTTTTPASCSSAVTGMVPREFLLLLQQQQQQQQCITSTSTAPTTATATTTTGEQPGEQNLFKFPFKLHHLLNEADRCGFDRIISWIPTGDGFRVHDPKTFAKLIMPRYFEMSHYKSFQRQLSLYSFKRSSEGVHRGKKSDRDAFFVLVAIIYH
jgi:hypothetical protein